MRKILLPLLIAVLGIIMLMCLNGCNSYESFGTSPGTMDQLQSTHVATQEDYHFYQKEYPKMVRREITELTDGDPGELRPWIFPWYGRGVVLIQ
jgi:hypothetical protein